MNKPFHNASKTLKPCLFSLVLGFCGQVYLNAQLTETTSINFGGGVDYKTDCSDVRDDRACDSNNMISDFTGTLSRRFGSNRIIDQAISTYPVKGLYRAYYSTGTTTRKATIMINYGKIYVDTTTSVTGTHIWSERKSGLNKSQNYEFRQNDQYVIIAGDSLEDNVLRYNIMADSVTENFTNDLTSLSPFITFKHHVFSKNYYLGANVKELTTGATYYPNRVRYSLIISTPASLSFTSMTALRYFDVPSNGEEITGIGEINNVHIFTPASISQLNFDVLNVGSQGGDQSLSKMVQGFGCIAPRTLVSSGKFYTFLSKDGIRIYDPTGRLIASDETKVISQNIEPIIKRILENGTYKNAHAVYYGKRNWYIFSYEDPLKYPQGRSNSTIVYDFTIGEWFPINNWLPEMWATFDNMDDRQELVYGDSADGYVYFIDQEVFQNDARKEISIDNADVHSKWLRVEQGMQILEGTASIRMTMPADTMFSSITYMNTINLGEWYDKSKTNLSDKLSFKVFASSLANIKTIRLDLELDTILGDFDANFTSVTITSATLGLGTSVWNTIEIKLSSFPILDVWVNTSSGILPFANAPTFYGIRFVSTAIGWAQLTFDDIRFVKGSETELNAFRKTKHFNLGSNVDKEYRQIILSVDQPATSKFYIDVLSNFGEFSNRISVDNSFDKDIFVTGYLGDEGIARLDSGDFTVKNSTVIDKTNYAPRPMTADENNVYVGDQYNHRIMKFDKNDLSIIVATAGSLGSGMKNLYVPFQMAVTKLNDDRKLYVCDFANHKLKVYNAKTLKFLTSFVDLGSSATNFNCPSGVAADDTNIFVVQDGNYRLQKFKDRKSTRLNSSHSQI